jgi:hypothetical protein
VILAQCSSDPPPQAAPPPPRHVTKKTQDNDFKYETGDISDWNESSRKKLRAVWAQCVGDARTSKNHETLMGEITLWFRTNKAGAVTFAVITDNTLGDRDAEKCILRAISATKWGEPMHSDVGEIKGYKWSLSSDDLRPADDGNPEQVKPAITKAKSEIASCHDGMKGVATATIYVKPGGKPLSVGIAVTDPGLEASSDCLADALMKLTYLNKSSWPIKVRVELP